MCVASKTAGTVVAGISFKPTPCTKNVDNLESFDEVKGETAVSREQKSSSAARERNLQEISSAVVMTMINNLFGVYGVDSA